MTTGKTIFVTVGTTLFQALIDSVLEDQVLDWLVACGYSRMVIQYGKGENPILPEATSKRPLRIDAFDFKASLEQDMLKADLILSHAGAGTVMEALRLKKDLAVVINTSLMHNHQTELACALGKRAHLFVVDEPAFLLKEHTWRSIAEFQPVAYDAGDEYNFPRLLDGFMGFKAKEI